MLQMNDTYKQAIITLGFDPQIFPLTTAARWGSDFRFDEDFAELKFRDFLLNILDPSLHDDREITVGSPAATQLINLTFGSSSSVITSVASKQLAVMSKTQFTTEVLNALAAQLENETAGSSEAVLLQSGLTKAQLDSITAARAALNAANSTIAETATFAHGTALEVSSNKTSTQTASKVKKTTIKKV